MKHKKYLAEASKGLINEFNEFLKTKGISTQEMSFVVKKVQFALDDNTTDGIAEVGLNVGRKCVKWDSKLVERTDPTTGKKYWQLVESCLQYEGEEQCARKANAQQGAGNAAG